MRRLALCLLAIALAGCNRHRTADVTLDADAAQRSATAAKTASDLAAAEAASQGPAPSMRAEPPKAASAEHKTGAVQGPEAEDEEAPDAGDAESNQ